MAEVRASSRGWGPGWPNAQTDKIVTVTFSNGVKIGMRREIAELVKIITEHSIKLGYAPRSGQTWGFANRAIRGTKTPSNHSWGLAEDENSLANPQRRPLTTDMPRWHIDLWKRYGFRWGGDYQSATPDSMHFEYLGTPTSARVHTDQARRELASPHAPVPVPKPTITIVDDEEEEMARPTLLARGDQPGRVFAFWPEANVRIPVSKPDDLRPWPDGYGPVLEVDEHELAAIPTPSGQTGLDTL